MTDSHDGTIPTGSVFDKRAFSEAQKLISLVFLPLHKPDALPKTFEVDTYLLTRVLAATEYRLATVKRYLLALRDGVDDGEIHCLPLSCSTSHRYMVDQALETVEGYPDFKQWIRVSPDNLPPQHKDHPSRSIRVEFYVSYAGAIPDDDRIKIGYFWYEAQKWMSHGSPAWNSSDVSHWRYVRGAPGDE